MMNSGEIRKISDITVRISGIGTAVAQLRLLYARSLGLVPNVLAVPAFYFACNLFMADLATVSTV
jgi:hypothetical protein